MEQHLLETLPEAKSAFIRFFAFNTLVDIVAYAEGDGAHWEDDLKGVLSSAHEACIRYESLFSRTIPTSDIVRLNEAQGAWEEVDPDTFEMLQAACSFCEASGGVFDITIGAASALWDFHEGIVPDPKALAEAMRHVDWHAIELRQEVERDRVRTFVRLADPRAKVDLGGIAKGWIADRLVELLAASSAVAGIVDLGGNVAVYGAKPDGSPWRVALRNPWATKEALHLGVMELPSGSVVTSGITERFFVMDGRRYHHILDARTGYPCQVAWASASVVADDSLTAEGFSTTMLVVTESEARAMMDANPRIREVIFVDDAGVAKHLR